MDKTYNKELKFMKKYTSDHRIEKASNIKNIIRCSFLVQTDFVILLLIFSPKVLFITIRK